MKHTWYIAKKIGFGQGAKFTRAMLILGVLSIALSISVMILASAITQGFQNQISHKIYNFWGHIHVSASYLNDFFDAEPIQLSKDQLATIEQLNLKNEGALGGVKSIDGIVQYPVIIQHKETLEGSILRAIEDSYRYDVFEQYLVEGHLDTFRQQSRSVLLSKEIQNVLTVNVGDYLILNFIKDGREVPRRFKVAGIYNTGIWEYDKAFIFVQRKEVASILNLEPNVYTSYEISLDHPQDIPQYDEFLYENIIPSNLFNYSVEELFSDIFSWIKLQATNEKIIIGLLLIVCVINMVTLFFILVMEKVQMIGLFKALGATHQKVRLLFIYLALRILFYGMAIGNLFALGLGWAQQHFRFLKLDESNYYIDAVPIDFNFKFILLINLITLVVCFFFLYLPAIILSKISPARTLRFT